MLLCLNAPTITMQAMRLEGSRCDQAQDQLIAASSLAKPCESNLALQPIKPGRGEKNCIGRALNLQAGQNLDPKSHELRRASVEDGNLLKHKMHEQMATVFLAKKSKELMITRSTSDTITANEQAK